METPVIKMKYSDIGNFGFSQLIQKISQTPTNNRNACHIHKITRELQTAREKIADDYQAEIVEKFGKRNDKGELIRPEGEPKGFEPIDGQEDAINKAHDEFGNKMAEIKWRPLTPTTLADIKISGAEIELLKDLFTEEEGPGIPNLADRLKSVQG
jgi:hypothetical protein